MTKRIAQIYFDLKSGDIKEKELGVATVGMRFYSGKSWIELGRVKNGKLQVRSSETQLNLLCVTGNAMEIQEH